MANLFENRLVKILLRNSAIAVAKAYRLVNRSDIAPFEKLEAISKLKVDGKLLRLYATEAEAIMTGRFIDILKIYKAEDFPVKNVEKINNELTNCIATSISNLGPRETEEKCSRLHQVPKDYVRTLIHEYTHWYKLAGTRTGRIIEKFSWKERIDSMSFTHLIYDKINLGEIVGEHFARIDKADIIGKGLSENDAKKILKEKISNRINDLAKNIKVIKYFLSTIEDLIILINIGSIISVFIEPATWALVEDDSYFENNINNYFTDKIMKKYAQQVYEESKKLGSYEEVVNRVKRVLQIDLTQYSNKDLDDNSNKDLDDNSNKDLDDNSNKDLDDNSNKDLDDIFKDMYEKFTKGNSNSDVSFSNIPLISVLVDLIIDYRKKPYEKEKINIITSYLLRNEDTLQYIWKILFKYKGVLARPSLPSVCSNLEYGGRLIGGCFNPDVGITGDKPVKRPFGSLEEIVGNLALSLKPALILAYLYSTDVADYKRAVQKIAERLKYSGTDDFTKIAIDEIKDLKIQLNNDMFYNTTTEICLNKDDKVACEEIGKFLKEFLRYWIYIVLRLGRAQEMLPNRHGIFIF